MHSSNHPKKGESVVANHQFDYAKSRKCTTLNQSNDTYGVCHIVDLKNVLAISFVCAQHVWFRFENQKKKKIQQNLNSTNIRWLRARIDIKINGWKSRVKMAHTKKKRNDNDDGVNYFRWQTNRELSKCVPHYTNENFPANL